MSGQQKSKSSRSSRLKVTGIVLIVLSFFGIVPIIIRVILELLLGHPAVNSSGLAIVNIGTLLSVLLGIVVGITLIVVGSKKKL